MPSVKSLSARSVTQDGTALASNHVVQLEVCRSGVANAMGTRALSGFLLAAAIMVD